MQRYVFQHNGLTLSYLDSGGNGQVLIALHAHWMEGITFAPLAATLASQWRVVALDQRGHGYSDHAATYTRDDYIGDLVALFAHLGLKEPVVMLGNSLGGVNTYQLAARYPNLVRAMIIEDIGVEISVDVSFSLAWGGTFKTREDLAQAVGTRLLTSLQDSFRQTKDGWRLAFDPREMIASYSLTEGDHWVDWLATNCPALLIRGQDSRVTTHIHLEQMAARRPNTFFKVLDGGHVVHVDNPTGFTETIIKFLLKL
jgi:esterase